MDVDLSTDLDALLPLVAPLLSGHSDVAIGTRLAGSSHVVRGARREAISRSYNLVLKAVLHTGFSDAQCGFKAMRRDIATVLLPLVEDQAWFFDTELLVLAEHNGMRIHEVPVDWTDDPDSRVDVVSTARADLGGVWRLFTCVARGRGRVGDVHTSRAHNLDDASPGLASQLVRFASIGMVSTVVFGLLFISLAGSIGPPAAVVVALLVCSLANTAANRRLTFWLRGRSDRTWHYAAGLVATAVGFVIPLTTLAAISAAGHVSRLSELAALTAANGAASFARFCLLRQWVFRPERTQARSSVLMPDDRA